MKQFLTLTVAAIALAGVTATAFAQMPERPTREEWQAMSEDDRAAFRQEVRGYLESLTPEERDALRAEKKAEMVERAAIALALRDTITDEEREARKAEHAAMQERAQATWNALSAAEQAEYLAEAEQKIAERGGRGPRKGVPGGGPAAGQGNPFGGAFGNR